MRKNILIAAIQPQRFLDQVEFAEKVSNEAEDMQLYFFVSDEVYSLYTSVVDNLSFHVINNPKVMLASKNNMTNFFKRRVRHVLSDFSSRRFNSTFEKLKSMFIFTTLFKNRERLLKEKLNVDFVKIKCLIEGLSISVIIINGDRHLGYEPVFLKVSKELSIPSVIVYLVDYADEERIFHNEVCTKKIKINCLTSSYIKQSQERLQYKMARNSYYYPHFVANALFEFGVLTTNPYVMGSGVSDILCLNNAFYQKKYIREGVLASKVKVVGDSAYDILYARFLRKGQVKKDINKKFDLACDKQTIVVALPQLAEHDILPWKEHWREVAFLLNTVNMTGQNVLVSLHPKMDPNKYRFLESRYNCKLLDERLSDVLVVADLFVATYSSTVVWAVLCGIKTLVVDFYGLNYNMYDFLTSIIKVNDKDRLFSSLEFALNSDVDFDDDWDNLSRNSVFDGNTTQRYIELINEVSSFE